jgi:microcompartment protein CcmL/EutN
MTGEVSAVHSSVEAGAAQAGEDNPVVSKIVIPSPSEELKRQLL